MWEREGYSSIPQTRHLPEKFALQATLPPPATWRGPSSGEGCTGHWCLTGCRHHVHSLGSGTLQGRGTRVCGRSERDAHHRTPAAVPSVCFGGETPRPLGSESSDPLWAGCPRFNCVPTHPFLALEKEVRGPDNVWNLERQETPREQVRPGLIPAESPPLLPVRKAPRAEVTVTTATHSPARWREGRAPGSGGQGPMCRVTQEPCTQSPDGVQDVRWGHLTTCAP